MDHTNHIVYIIVGTHLKHIAWPVGHTVYKLRFWEIHFHGYQVPTRNCIIK